MSWAAAPSPSHSMAIGTGGQGRGGFSQVGPIVKIGGIQINEHLKHVHLTSTSHWMRGSEAARDGKPQKGSSQGSE